MKKLVIIILLSFSLLSFTAAFVSAEWKETEISKLVKLPYKIKIIPPNPALPPEIAAWSGRWEGLWKTKDFADFPSVLLIEKVTEEKVEGKYCWGGDVRTAGYSSFKEKISGTPPKFEIRTVLSSGWIHFVFQKSEDLKTVHGLRKTSFGSVSEVIMEKIE